MRTMRERYATAQDRAQPCGIRFGIEDGWCGVHSPDPERVAQRKEGQRRGQLRRARPRTSRWGWLRKRRMTEMLPFVSIEPPASKLGALAVP